MRICYILLAIFVMFTCSSCYYDSNIYLEKKLSEDIRQCMSSIGELVDLKIIQRNDSEYDGVAKFRIKDEKNGKIHEYDIDVYVMTGVNSAFKKIAMYRLIYRGTLLMSRRIVFDLFPFL